MVLAVGETVIVSAVCPEITFVPAAPVPHWYNDPLAETPPEAVNVVLDPLQIDVVPEMAVGAVE